MIIKTKKLKNLLSLLATQIDEVTIRPDDDGWKIKAIDPSHTSMISASLPAQSFAGYRADDDFAISLKNVLKALGNAGDDVDISISEGVLVVESEGLRSRFPLINPNETDPKIPDIKCTGQALVPVDEITRMMSAVYGSVDVYRLSIADGVFTIAAEDQSRNGATLTLREKCLGVDGQGKSTFAIELLDRFLKAVSKDAVLEINLGDDMPLIINVQDADSEIRYLLAPRIESE